MHTFMRMIKAYPLETAKVFSKTFFPVLLPFSFLERD
jgi:hypothetical protein